MKKLTIFSTLLLFSLLGFANERISSEDYIDQWKITAIEQMNSHAIPASITLAQGILESGSGNSQLAKNANNHFGIKCHKVWTGKTFYQDDDEKDECFRSYEHAAQSYEDHSDFLTSRQRYSDLFKLKITDYVGWAKGLKRAGYATNPKYADLLIQIIKRYNLDQYDKMPLLPIEIEREKEQKELTASRQKDTPHTVFTATEKSAESSNETANIHKVQLNKNRTRYILVEEGDTFYRISKEFNMGLWQLYKYNELGKRDVLTKGEIIYLDPKRSRASRGNNVHLCKEDMSLREVSQHEGIKLKKIMQYNVSTDPDKVLPKGTKVILR